MWEDAIVEEVHALREQLLARFGGDLHQYCEYVHALPKTPGRDAVQNTSPDAPATVGPALVPTPTR